MGSLKWNGLMNNRQNDNDISNNNNNNNNSNNKKLQEPMIFMVFPGGLITSIFLFVSGK